ncbi:MAG: hypothetical protein QHC65_16355 [Sphingomonas sp.]|nr:hypothetical protein [Sphingomonas sp.]MDX3885997.1 hypothetical protein [Sphingomonas sp.]
MIGSLSELALLPGMPSEPTIRKLIEAHSGFPILRRGTNGRAYEFDLGEAAEFIRGIQRREEEEARARNEEVRQFGLSLLGDDAASATATPAGLSAAERKAMLEEELVAIKVAERRGELVRKAGVVAAVNDFVLMVARRLETLPDRLAKRADLPREALLSLERLIEIDRREIADAMEKMKDAAPNSQDIDTLV